jgi:hypothetical protein
MQPRRPSDYGSYGGVVTLGVTAAIASELVRPNSWAQLSMLCWSCGVMPLLTVSASIMAASACCLVNSRSGSQDTTHAPCPPAAAFGLHQATCTVSVLAISSSLIRRAVGPPPIRVSGGHAFRMITCHGQSNHATGEHVSYVMFLAVDQRPVSCGRGRGKGTANSGNS